MPNNQEIQDLLIRVQGQERVEELRRQIDAETKTLIEAQIALRQNTIDHAVFERQVALTGASLLQNQQQLAATQKSLGGMSTIAQQAAYGLGDLMQTSGSLGQKMMAVSNNVQFAAAQFGPWGMAAGLAFTAIASAVQMYEKSAGSVQDGSDLMMTELQRLGKEIDEINKKKVKVTADYEAIEEAEKRVRELKQGLNDLENMDKEKSEDERQSGRDFSHTWSELGRDKRTQIKELMIQMGVEKELNTNEKYLKAQADYHAADDLLKKRTEDLKLPAMSEGDQMQRLFAQSEASDQRAKALESIRAQGKSIYESSASAVGKQWHDASQGDQEAMDAFIKKIEFLGGDDIAASLRSGTVASVKQFDAETLPDIEENERRLARTNERIEAARKAKRDKAEATSKANAEQQKVDAQAARLLSALGSDPDKGVIHDVNEAMAAKKSDDEITKQFLPGMLNRVNLAGLGKHANPEAIAKSALAKLIEDQKLKAAGRADTVEAGAGEYLGDEREKSERKANAQTRRSQGALNRAKGANRAAERAQIQELGENMQSAYRAEGFNPLVSHQMAQGALNKMRQGVDQQTAMMMSMSEMLNRMAGLYDGQQQQLNTVRSNLQNARARGQTAQNRVQK